jgi:hypothetical protein
MPWAWKRFLFIRLPLAAVAIGVVCQLAAMALSQFPMRRNRADELALAVVNDPRPHRIVLIGDSITRNATLQYAAGTESEVLNLATQRIVGLPGGMLLLQRYLKSHPAPQYVVIAAAPDDYHIVSPPEWIHYYFWNTFDRPDERKFLKSQMPAIDARERFPAAMDVQERILERLMSLMKRGPAKFDPPPPMPDPHAAVEPITDDQATSEEENIRLASNDLSIAPFNAAAVAGMCELSRQYGFVLNIVWAPMPPQVLKGRLASGQLASLDSNLRDIFAANRCQTGPIFNMNDVQTFTNFDIESFHLRGSGWEQRAASVLNQYLHDLPDRSKNPPSPLKAAGEASATRRSSAGL